MPSDVLKKVNAKAFDAMRYTSEGEVTDAKLKDRPTPNFGTEWRTFFMPPPPKNSSEEAKSEIVEMRELHNGLTQAHVWRIQYEDRPDVEEVFLDYLKKAGFKVSRNVEKEVAALSEQLATIGWHFKDRFGRIRPNAWLEEMNRSFRFPKSFTANSPAYPSNHALIGAFLAEWLARKYPRAREPLEVIGKQLGWNRVMAGWHYPSDYGMARMLANELWKHYREVD